MSDQFVIEGEIVFDQVVKSFSGATAYVRLLDTSRADAPSTVIVEEVIQGVSHQAGSTDTQPIRLEGQVPDENARYELAVHIALGGAREINQGDFITTQSYPVLTRGYPRQVSVRVQEV